MTTNSLTLLKRKKTHFNVGRWVCFFVWLMTVLP